MPAERSRLLDTNILDVLMDERAPDHARLRARLREVPADAGVFLSVVALAEKRFGFALHPDSETATRMIDELDGVLVALPLTRIDEEVAPYYGQLRAALFLAHAPRDEKGDRKRRRSASELMDRSTDRVLGIQENDLWMAAEALARDLTLATRDRMTRIHAAAREAGLDLHLERW